MKSRLLPVFFLLLTALVHPVLAQEPPPEVSLRFLFLDETAGAYSLKTGDSYRQLTTTPYVIGRPVVAKPETRLEIFKDSAVPDPVTGEIARLKIATVTAPSGTTGALVVVTPRPVPSDAASAPTYDVVFFDNDSDTFPEKSIRIINLGHAAMAAQFGSAQVVVPPGGSQMVRPDTDHRNRVFSKIAVATDAGWKLLYDSVTIVRPDERLTGVFVYSPSGLRHTYTDAELAEFGDPPPGHFWLTYSAAP